MKKVLFIALLSIVTFSLAAEAKSVTIDNKRTDDKFKAGLILGYPSGLTAGWRLSDLLEMNFHVATHYSDIIIGAAPMFTLVNINIADEIFPLSLGPMVNVGFDFSPLNNVVDIDILANLRVEYSFKNIPLNLFLEGGGGIKINLGDEVNPIGGQGSGAIGVRYIF
jgi:hypothetical protein